MAPNSHPSTVKVPNPTLATEQGDGKWKRCDDENDDEQLPKEEDEDAYRKRVYGVVDKHAKVEGDCNHISNGERVFRSLSKRFSNAIAHRRSTITEALPDTPAGWTVLASVLSSICLGYEINLQRSLTAAPTVYGQLAEGPMKAIYERLTASPDSILSRTILPSLFVGTRGVMASTAAYLGGGPHGNDGYVHFREVVKMSSDGAAIALDWELPVLQDNEAPAEKNAALCGPLQRHVVVILHGINNDSKFGYVKSLMRACTKRGWAAVGMNMRGCGGISLTTPRGYTGGYTGDIRGVIQILSGRIADGKSIFLIGNSLGANLITKYLGEEGQFRTLPACVAGGVSLGNPMHLHGKNIPFPWGHLLSLGARKSIIEHLSTFRQMKSTFYQERIRKALLAPTIGDFDEAFAPIFITNSPQPPFEPKIGYENAEAYWKDASSYRYVRHVSVPLLQLASDDDFLVSTPSRKKLCYSISNPNVLVVNTRCGGHLGWHECPPDTGSIFGFGTSWADTATVDFIDAILQGKLDEVQRSADKTHLERFQSERLTSKL